MPRPLIRTLAVGGGLLGLLLLAALVAPLWLDRERVARDLEAAIGDAVGAPVQIDGLSGRRLLPVPSLRLDRLVMPTTDGGLQFEAVGVQLRLAAKPLVNGQVTVRSLALERLLLHWDAPMTDQRLTLTAHAVTVGPIAADRPGQVRAQVRIDGTAPTLAGDLTLDAGFRYAAVASHDPDRPDASALDADALDANEQVGGNPLTAGRLTLTPLHLHGSDLVIGNAHGVPLDLTATARFDPDAALVELTELALALGRLQFTGNALLRPAPTGLALTGTVALAPVDLHDWLQRHVDERGPAAPDCLSRVAFETGYRWQFTDTQRTLSLTQGRLLVDGSRAALTARLAWTDGPVVDGDRAGWAWTAAGSPVGAVAAVIDRIDLDGCLAAAATGTGHDPLATNASVTSPASTPISGSITAAEPSTSAPGPAIPAPARADPTTSDHWVGTPTAPDLMLAAPDRVLAAPDRVLAAPDLMLAAPDLPLPATSDMTDPALTWRLEAEQLRLGGLAYEAPVVVASTDRDGLVLDLTAALYGGPLVARLTWEPPQTAPAGQTPGTDEATTASPIALRVDAAEVDIGALLANLSGQRPAITGRGTLHAALVAPANDLARLRDAIGGEVAVRVDDGTVTGIDLPRLLRLAGSTAPTPGPATDASTSSPRTAGQAAAATPFASLSASATGADGRFDSQDISARSPYLDLTGTGQFDLPRETLALDLTARLRRPPDGSGIRELEDLPIPVTLTGPWAAPHWQVDQRAVLAEIARRALDRQGGDLLQDLEDRIGVPGLREGLEQGLRGLFGR